MAIADLSVCVCIPTLKRPHIVERLLENLTHQTSQPERILVVDASPDDGTEQAVKRWQPSLNQLQYVKAGKGLTLQRNVGIDSCEEDLILMLDDDVMLEPDCIAHLRRFMTNDQEAEYAAVGAFITNEYTKNIFRYQKLYKKLGIYNGPLKPGRWLYCGAFLQLSTLRPFSGIYPSQFLPAGASIFRTAVARVIRPDSNFRFGGEDKHWTLRLSSQYKVGVLGDAKLDHEHYAGGGRKRPIVQARVSTENLYIILNECDPNLTTQRKIAFKLYKLLDILRLFISRIPFFNFKNMSADVGVFYGWLNIVFLGYKGIKKRRLPH